MTKLHPVEYLKAITALVAGLTVWAATYFPDATELKAGLGLLSTVLGAAAVFTVPNLPAPGQPSKPEISEQGYITGGTVLAVIGLVVVVFVVLKLAGLV